MHGYIRYYFRSQIIRPMYCKIRNINSLASYKLLIKPNELLAIANTYHNFILYNTYSLHNTPITNNTTLIQKYTSNLTLQHTIYANQQKINNLNNHIYWQPIHNPLPQPKNRLLLKPYEK